MSDTESTGIRDPEGPTDIIETDYTIGQDNLTNNLGPLKFDVHNPVFAISGLVIVAFVIITLALQNQADAVFVGVRDWLTGNLA